MFAPELDGASAVETVKIGGRIFVYVVARQDDGLQAFELDPADGMLTPTFHISDDWPNLLGEPIDIVKAELDGETYLFVSSRENGAIPMYRVEADGALTLVDLAESEANAPLDRQFKLATAQVGEKTFLLSTDVSSDVVNVFEVSASGLTAASNTILLPQSPFSIATATVGGSTFVFLPQRDFVSGGQIDVLQLDEMGTALPVGFQATPNFTFESLTAGRFHGRDMLFVGSFDDSNIISFEIGSDGSLTQLASYAHVQGESGIDSFQFVEIGGNDYLVGEDSSQNAITLFDVDHQGRLSLIDTIKNDFALDTVRDLSVVEEGGRVFIVATSFDGDSVSSLELTNIGVFEQGGAGRQRLDGTAGADILEGQSGADRLFGQAGNDVLNGGRGNDTVNGGSGHDMLRGGVGNDVLYGGQGRDTLSGDGGNDTLNGGAGYDLADFTGSNSAVEINLSSDPANFTSIEGLIGSTFADMLRGDSGRNILVGGLGDDTLNGGMRSDSLNGGEGDDILIGGRGSDVLSGGSGSDVFVFSDSSGSDRILDFILGEDMIDLSQVSGVLSDFDVVVRGDSRNNPDVAQLFAGDVVITLEGVSSEELDPFNPDNFFVPYIIF